MEEKNENIPVNPQIKLHTSKRFENFWYYYKWHTIVGVFVAVVLTVIIVQLFTKTSYDLNVLYAGEKQISQTSLSGDGKTELSDLSHAIESVAGDYNNDGKVRFNLQTLRILSENELAEETKDLKDAAQKTIIENETQTNRQRLRDMMFNGYYLYFLSEDIFFEYDGNDRSDSMFVNLAEYTKDGGSYEFASERGIYISSLALYQSSELSMLPPDTVVCLRIPGAFDGKNEQKALETAEQLLKSLLAFGE